MVCLTLLVFTYLTRNSLCEIKYKDDKKEVNVFITHESG
ncbi:Hok/Gef family protein (plasmid) [Escherichia coli]